MGNIIESVYVWVDGQEKLQPSDVYVIASRSRCKGQIEIQFPPAKHNAHTPFPIGNGRFVGSNPGAPPKSCNPSL